jgi:hypothetical protein
MEQAALENLQSLPVHESASLVQGDEQCEFAIRFYVDAEGRQWACWPMSMAQQMWRDVMCSQDHCNRPAMWVGLVNLLGDGTLYYNSAAAWCYWCMPGNLLTAEAQNIRLYAEWARQITLDECVAILHRAWLDADVNDAVDSVLTQLIDTIRHSAESPESIVDSFWPPQPDISQGHPTVLRYEERPSAAKCGAEGLVSQVKTTAAQSRAK